MHPNRQTNSAQTRSNPTRPSTSQLSSGETAPEDYIPLSKLNRHVEPGPSGKRRHATTFYRYARRGVQGVRLKTWRFPDGLRTTISAWYEFIEQLTAVAGRHLPEQQKTAPRASVKRQNAVEAEIEAVRASIGRKALSSKKETTVPQPGAPMSSEEGQS